MTLADDGIRAIEHESESDDNPKSCLSSGTETTSTQVVMHNTNVMQAHCSSRRSTTSNMVPNTDTVQACHGSRPSISIVSLSGKLVLWHVLHVM